MAILQADGVTLPEPSELTVTNSDMSSEESGRDLTATMNKDIVAVKRRIDAKWKVLNWTETSRLLTAVESKAEFNLRYPDPKLGKYTTKTFYVNDRTAGAFTLIDGKEKWKDISFSFIEV